jgi:heme/copper-type cytochrome/quinol oxidase subunit 1
MDPFVRRFIRASLLWLGIGVVLGLTMALDGRWLALRPAHMHANLLGFVSMMIFGVAYHVIPRFTGRPLHSPRLAHVHLWCANLGLGAMVGGFVLRLWFPAPARPLLAAGAVLASAGAFIFIHNLWRTLEDRAAERGLPTVDTAAIRRTVPMR